MPSKQYEQNDFSIGEISPDHVWRTDLEIRKRSLRGASNVQLLVGGGAKKRSGTTRLAALGGDGQVIDLTIAGMAFMLVFTPGRLDVWDKTARTIVQSFTGQPWDATTAPALTVSPHGSKTFVFHAAIQPREIDRSSAGVWSVTPYAFTAGIGGALQQPYFRFAAPGVTMTPSSTLGSITLTASAPYFVAGHVGLRMRLQGREVAITAVTDSTHATATVIQQLFPTKTLPVNDSTGFEVGEVVEGKDSTAKGEITAIPDGTHITVLMQSFTDFFFSTSGESIIGANKVATSTSAATLATDAAVLGWTEQAISALRGWPGTGVVHRNRLFMSRLALIPFGIVASAIGDFNDCEVGANDADGIFEELGDEGTGFVEHIVSAEQLIVLTSRRAFYYPESEANPIRPSGFDLLQIGPVGASSCRPVLIPEGVLFGNAGGGAIQAAIPTGDVRRSWRTAEMSRLAAHLIKRPRVIAYVEGAVDPTSDSDLTIENQTIRYAYSVNVNGTLAVLSYSETQADAVPGWTPWDTQGVFRWVAADQGECWAVVQRTYPGISTTKYTLEIFEAERLVDCACDVTGADLQGAASGQTIQTPSGAQTADFVYRCAALAGATCSLTVGGDYIGEVTLSSAGDFGAPDLPGAIVVGFGFQTRCVPWPPMDTDDQRARRRKRRISRALVRYQGKGMVVNGKLRSLYDAGEDTSQPAPVRDELYAVPCFGWSQEPTVPIESPYASPWLLLGYSFEVSS